MRIDAHHHLWDYNLQEFGWIAPDAAIARSFAAPDLLAAMASGGVDRAIAVQARQCEAETAKLLAVASQYRQIVGVVGWVDLRRPDVAARLDALAHPLLVGYRHVVQDEANPDFLAQPTFRAGVAAVLARGLTYDLLVNHAQLASVPDFVDALSASHPSARFVLDHGAKPAIAHRHWQPWADQIAAIAQRPQVWCKISGLVTEADHHQWTAADITPYLAHLLACFGPDRLIFGSDWPVCLLATSYARQADLIESFIARHCPAHGAAIWAGNAMAAYRLGPLG